MIGNNNAAGAPFAAFAEGLRIQVRLTPSGGADRIDGLGQDDAGRTFIKARVRAAPEDGRANEALEALFAKALETPRSAVKVARGAKSRIKTIEVRGDTRELQARAAALLKDAGKT
ncbi:MAG: DUF167 family protein [Caulobacterales bacterium]